MPTKCPLTHTFSALCACQGPLGIENLALVDEQIGTDTVGQLAYITAQCEAASHTHTHSAHTALAEPEWF